jgi:hypothetical protein
MTFNDHNVLPFRLDYSENISVKWVNDIDAQHIGPGLTGFLDGQQTVRKRRFSVDVLVNGDDVEELETFFAEIGCSAFWLPDMPRDFDYVLSDSGPVINVSSGDLDCFLDDNLSHSFVCLPHDGGDPIFSLIYGVAVVGDLYQLSLNDVIDTVSSDTHECGLATLVSVNGDTVTFEPVTNELWRLNVELTEQPYEIDDPQPVRTIEYRYTFRAEDHLGTSLEHNYTTGEGDDTYSAIDILHDEISFGLLADDNSCTISMQAVENGPFSAWTPFYFGPPIIVTVEQVETVAGETETTTIFSGECVSIARQGQLIEATFEPRAFKGKIPNFFASPRDNMYQWSQHDVDDFAHEVVVLSVEDNLLSVSWNDSVDPTILENGHLVYIPDDGFAEVRDILAVIGDLGDSAIGLRISGPVSANEEDALNCYEGYDGSPDSYLAMFGSLAGFGGHPWITTTNPSFSAIEMVSGGGKK